MRKILEKYAPGTLKFFIDFFEAMNNKKSGHSLRKWLAVGFFWLVAECVFKFTTSENLAVVLGILTGMITALVITYTAGNIQEKKIDNSNNPLDLTNEQK